VISSWWNSNFWNEQRWIDLNSVQDHEHQLMLELAVPFWQMKARCGHVILNVVIPPSAGQPTSPVFLWKIELGCAGERWSHYIYDDHQDKRTI